MWWILCTVTLVVIYVTWKTTDRLAKRKICQQKIAVNQKLVRQYTEALEAHLKEDGVLVTPARERIVQLPVGQLLLQLKTRQLKAVDVLRAFQAKALEATKKTNCVVLFISEAEEWAQNLDKSEIQGPLHGLPLSVKECYDIEGYDSTAGLTKKLDKPAAADAVLVAVLKKKGAVPFCKTNVPQTMLSYDCNNPIYGETTHPENPTRSPGGSTGGEAVLIAQRGSPLGIGTDVAGSVRIPAFSCGITALKTTSDRLSMIGGNSSATTTGIQGVKSSAGVMGPDVATVATGMKALLDGPELYQRDPAIPPLHWQEQLFSPNRKLRIGYFEEDGCNLPTPGCCRALHEAAAALKQAGHELIPFRPPDIPSAIKLLFGFANADKWRSIAKDLLQDEIVDPDIAIISCKAFIPDWVIFLLKPLMNRGLIPTLPDGFTTSYSLWKAMARRSCYIREVISQWTQAKLDVCICPGMAMPSQPLRYAAYNIPAISYNVLYNMLDFTVGMVPVTRETEDDQKRLETYPTANNFSQKLIKKGTAGAVGLPIGVQVIGLPWQEEMVLRGMLELEMALSHHPSVVHSQ